MPRIRRAGGAAQRLRSSIQHDLRVSLSSSGAPFRCRKRRAVSTALVAAAVDISSTEPAVPGARPRADFLAQLIATAAHAPQTRPRRRAEPAEAVALYGATEQCVRVRRPMLFCSL